MKNNLLDKVPGLSVLKGMTKDQCWIDGYKTRDQEGTMELKLQAYDVAWMRRNRQGDLVHADCMEGAELDRCDHFVRLGLMSLVPSKDTNYTRCYRLTARGKEAISEKKKTKLTKPEKKFLLERLESNHMHYSVQDDEKSVIKRFKTLEGIGVIECYDSMFGNRYFSLTNSGKKALIGV